MRSSTCEAAMRLWAAEGYNLMGCFQVQFEVKVKSYLKDTRKPAPVLLGCYEINCCCPGTVAIRPCCANAASLGRKDATYNAVAVWDQLGTGF